MENAIWVSGAPSRLGGADTELLNNIYLWRDHGIDVNIVPCYGITEEMKREMVSIGCRFYQHDPKIFADKIVVSYCNGNFLKELPKIIEHGRPKKVVWFNCMTWTFPDEVRASKYGWIDLHGFVSPYQRRMLLDSLRRQVGVRVDEFEGYRPYFKIKPDMFRYRPPEGEFVLGRLSRPDPSKYSSDTWKIFDGVQTGNKVKKIHIMGYDMNVESKLGKPPEGLDVQLRPANDIPVAKFYRSLHCLIHKTGGSRESYCRIVPEAYAHGVPIIVEDDYAFPDLVINGVTGFRCKTSEEMIEKATLLANNESLRKTIVHNAYEFLKDQIASPERCISPWLRLLNA